MPAAGIRHMVADDYAAMDRETGRLIRGHAPLNP